MNIGERLRGIALAHPLARAEDSADLRHFASLRGGWKVGLTVNK
jgi:hypothetical protein